MPDKKKLSRLPSVDECIKSPYGDKWLQKYYRNIIVRSVREAIDSKRKELLGGADPDISIDAIALADKVDVMVIVTGDADFVPLVYALKSKGVKVEIMSFPENTGRELIDVADKYIEITDEMLIYDNKFQSTGEKEDKLKEK